ncbi:MAG TPA: LysR family transcriptional regulator [Acetobacteraceae bacterium]|nr:LysR family transcriptional regulator [Acetobacteraceae bacterium]
MSGPHAGPQPFPLADPLGAPPGCPETEGGRGIVKDWDDLRFFLAVARLGSLSAASRVLKVDPATVGRRVARLEATLEVRCFERRADGYRLTGEGQKLLVHAERVEADLHGLARALDAEDRGIAGLVTVTASDSVALPLLIPALPRLRDKHPGIRIDLISSNQVLSLARREADIAVRTVRPEEGDLLTRRIGTMGYGLYASPDYLERAGVPNTEDDLTRHALLDWFDEYPRVATASWFRKIAERSDRTMRMSGVKERLSAAQAGMGIACLSFMMARGAGLVRVLPELAVPSVELWLVTHPDSARAKRVRAVMDFIVGTALAANGQLSKPA